jgi:hypothetical protein
MRERNLPCLLSRASEAVNALPYPHEEKLSKKGGIESCPPVQLASCLRGVSSELTSWNGYLPCSFQLKGSFASLSRLPARPYKLTTIFECHGEASDRASSPEESASDDGKERVSTADSFDSVMAPACERDGGCAAKVEISTHINETSKARAKIGDSNICATIFYLCQE